MRPGTPVLHSTAQEQEGIFARTIVLVILLTLLGGTAFCQTVSPQSSGPTVSAENIDKAAKLLEHAVTIANDGNLEGAIPEMRAAVDLDPRNSKAWNVMARTYFYQKHYEEAIEAMTQAISLQDTANGRVERASFCEQVRRYSCVDDDFQHAQALDSNEPFIYGQMTRLKLMEGQYGAAAAHLARYAQLGGSDRTTWMYGLTAQVLNRQFPGSTRHLPPSDLNATFLTDAELKPIAPGMRFGAFMLLSLVDGALADPAQILGEDTEIGGYSLLKDYKLNKPTIAMNKRYRMVASADKPVELAPGFFVWDATVVMVAEAPHWGIFLEDGTHIKHLVVENGTLVRRVGVVRNRVFQFEAEAKVCPARIEDCI